MKEHALKILFIFLLMALTCSFASAEDEIKLEDQIQSLVEPLIKEQRLHAVSIGIIKDGKKYSFGFGRVYDDKETPDDKTIYEIGSISKVFTATMLARMVVDGKMNLDDAAKKYLDNAFKMPEYQKTPITLRHLTQHKSGLPRMPNNFQPENIDNPYADYDKEKLYEFLNSCKLERKPGESFQYSNLAVGTLGHILELSTQKDYQQLLKDIISEPLKMQDTVVSLNSEKMKRLAEGHNGQDNVYPNWDLNVLMGAGGIRSTVHDMLIFLEANLNPDETALGKAIKLTQRPPDNTVKNMGLGWHVKRNQTTFWHNGQTGGYHSFSMFDSKEKIALVILSSTASNLVDKLGASIRHLLEKGEIKHVEFKKPIILKREKLKEYLGTYYMSRDFVLEVTLGKKHLLVKASGQDAFPVYPSKEDSFFYKIVQAQISFERKEGKVIGLVLHQNGAHMKALKDKLPPPPEYQEIELSKEILKNFIGRYQLNASFAITITVEGSRLLAQATGQKKVPIYPMSENKFFYKIVDAQISFNKNKKGKVTGLILHQNGMNQPATRIDE